MNWLRRSRIIGTSPDTIDLAEDRDRFRQDDAANWAYLSRSPAWRAISDEALEIAKKIGYPLMVRPSYVLGGRAMEVIYDEAYAATLCRRCC